MGWAVAKLMSYPPFSDMADGGGHAACSQLPRPSLLFLPAPRMVPGWGRQASPSEDLV